MAKVTQLPESEDNSDVVKLMKLINSAIYDSGLEVSQVEITGALFLCWQQMAFDSSIDQVEWED